MNLKVNMKKISFTCIAAAVAINGFGEIINTLITEKSVDGEKFSNFIDEISERDEGKKFVIYLDNASVHKCKVVR